MFDGSGSKPALVGVLRRSLEGGDTRCMSFRHCSVSLCSYGLDTFRAGGFRLVWTVDPLYGDAWACGVSALILALLVMSVQSGKPLFETFPWCLINRALFV